MGPHIDDMGLIVVEKDFCFFFEKYAFVFVLQLGLGLSFWSCVFFFWKVCFHFVVFFLTALYLSKNKML